MIVRCQSGLCLIEGLAALLLLAFGVLGAAAMNARALGELNASRSYNRATVLAVDLANRIRAYAPAESTSGGTPSDCAAAPGACLPAQMPAEEFDDWLARVESSLPAGSARVERLAANGLDHYAIELSWHERGGFARSHSLTFAPGSVPR